MAELARLNVLLGADATELERALSGAADKIQAAGRKMQRVGRTLSTTVTLPIAALGAASVKMASDAEEASNKFDVVMGDSADRVRERLMELHDTIPLTTAEMESMAAGIQDLLVPMGVARGDAADMSAGMVELAGDIASFNDVLPTEALEAMRSALAGESEPMRRFGVDTRVARLEALAMEKGLIGVGEELTETARAQAVMLAIQQDSKDAMGDAADTVGSTSNQMKMLVRNIKELGITIGQILIPIVRPMIARMSDVAEILNNLSPTTQKVVVAVAALAAAIGPVLVVLGTLSTLAPVVASGLGLLISPLGLAAAAVGSLVAAGVALVKNWNVISYEVGRVADTIREHLVEAWRVISFEVGRLVDGIRQHLVDRFGEIVTAVREKVDAVKGFFRGLFEAVVGGSYIPEMISGIGQHFERLDLEMVEPAKEATGKVEQAFQSIAQRGLDTFADFAVGAGGSISDFVESAIADLGRLVAKILAVKALTSFFPGIGGFLGLPGLAMGGPVQVGQPYLVGERGPEMFVPQTSGQVVPNHALAGGSQSMSLHISTDSVPEPTDYGIIATKPQVLRLFRETIENLRSDGFPI